MEHLVEGCWAELQEAGGAALHAATLFEGGTNQVALELGNRLPEIEPSLRDALGELGSNITVSNRLWQGVEPDL